MKRLQGLIAATFITAIVAVGTVGIGVNALSNPEQRRRQQLAGAGRAGDASCRPKPHPIRLRRRSISCRISSSNIKAASSNIRRKSNRSRRNCPMPTRRPSRRSRFCRRCRNAASSKSRATGASSCAAINGLHTQGNIQS